jgi:hypothetical protein
VQSYLDNQKPTTTHQSGGGGGGGGPPKTDLSGFEKVIDQYSQAGYL